MTYWCTNRDTSLQRPKDESFHPKISSLIQPVSRILSGSLNTHLTTEGHGLPYIEESTGVSDTTIAFNHHNKSGLYNWYKTPYIWICSHYILIDLL